LSEEIIKSGPGKIIISMDGLDQDIYSRYRQNGDLEKVKEGIRNISKTREKLRSNFRIEVQMLVNRFNEKQVEEFRKFTKEMSVIPVLKSMQIYDKDSINFWLPAEEKFRRYRKNAGEFSIKSTLPDRCYRLWSVPVITWDGKVLPCCFDKDASYVMGDLRESTFSEIWKGEKFRNFRKDVLEGRNRIDICRNCTSGLNLQKK
jgi:radical SAM protein with 4Fe4S-binding SPASM domain